MHCFFWWSMWRLSAIKTGPVLRGVWILPCWPPLEAAALPMYVNFLLLKLLWIWIRVHVSYSELILNSEFWGFTPTKISEIISSSLASTLPTHIHTPSLTHHLLPTHYLLKPLFQSYTIIKFIVWLKRQNILRFPFMLFSLRDGCYFREQNL